MALKLVRGQTLGFLLASLLLWPACAPEEPPDIPNDVVADYMAAVDDCIAKSEAAQPVLTEAHKLPKKYYDEITTAITAQPDGEGPFTFRFDEDRILTAYGKYENYQIYVTMPSGVAFEGGFMPPDSYVDPYFPDFSATTPVKTGVLGAYSGTTFTFVGTSHDPTTYEPETKGGGGTCETENSSIGYSVAQSKTVFFGAIAGRSLPTIYIHYNRVYEKATICRAGTCEDVEGENVKRFADLEINRGIGPLLDYGLQPVIRGKNR